jgi:competence CoiA-like predicted nuclease
MIFAKEKNGKLVQVKESGHKAFCPVCNAIVTGKIYKDKVNHFAHIPDDNCGLSNGIISDWHLNWQSKFDNCEVSYPYLGLRADVVLKNGLVIEFQNSNISFEDIRKRENGYKKMIWLFNLTQSNDDRVFISNDDYFYWEYFKKNWILCAKPFFFHMPNNMILQIREPKIYYDENKGGYPMPCLKSRIWNYYDIEEFLQVCNRLDLKRK